MQVTQAVNAKERVFVNKIMIKALNFTASMFMILLCIDIITGDKEEMLISICFASLLQITAMNMRDET